MSQLKIKFFGPFRDLFGGREKVVDFPSDGFLRLLLERICDTPDRRQQTFTESGALSPHVVIMINGRPVPSAGGLETPLQEGDVIAIFPFLGGG